MKSIILITLLGYLLSQARVCAHGRKDGFHITEKHLKAVKEGVSFIKSLGEMAKIVGPTAQKLLVLAPKFAKFLGPVGAIVSLAAAFLPKEKSAELRAIEDGFAHIDMRFDKIDVSIKKLKRIAVSAVEFNEYNKIRRDVNVANDLFNNFINDTQVKYNRDMFERICRDKDVSPSISLDLLAEKLLGKRLGVSVSQVLLTESEYDGDELARLFGAVFVDIGKAAILTQTCVATTYPKDTFRQEETAMRSQNIFVEIYTKYQSMWDEMLQNGHKIQLRDDVQGKLDEWKFIQNEDFCIKLKKFLTKKYPKQHWTVIVLNKDNGENSFMGSSGNSFISKNLFARNLYVSWSDMEQREWTNSLLENFRIALEHTLCGCSCAPDEDEMPDLKEKIQNVLEMADSYVVSRLSEHPLSNIGAHTTQIYVCYWYFAFSVVEP